MRFAWMLGACAWFGCTHHASTSDYLPAAAFAAAAGVAQVAELRQNGQSVHSCGPMTCNGCCDLADYCVDGTDDEACGAGGSVCHDCFVNGHQTCDQGACSPISNGPSAGSSFVSGSTPPPQASCGQAVVFCFAGTHSECARDTSGCVRCSCTPDTR